jgi:hypothetical protein
MLMCRGVCRIIVSFVPPLSKKQSWCPLLDTFFFRFCYIMRELFAHSLVRIVVAIRLGEGAVGGAELVGALLPVLDLLAGP